MYGRKTGTVLMYQAPTIQQQPQSVQARLLLQAGPGRAGLPLQPQGVQYGAGICPQPGVPASQSQPQPTTSELDPSYSEKLQDKVKGIVNLVEKERGVRRPKLIDFVRKCPVKWAQQVKPDTMNVPVYGWEALAEIIASLSGRADPLSGQALLAKLQHIQSVFEVCCINSTATEYNNYGWTLARHYAAKVQAKVDEELVDWSTLPPGVQTSDLVSAQMEFPRPVEKKAPGKKSDEERSNGNATVCYSYNTCTAEGKCDYEVAHPGKTCLRKHECSWCRKTFNKGHRHQIWKCAKKVEAGQ